MTTAKKEEDIVHLLSSDEELIPIPTRACQFSSFLSVALRRREDFGGFVSGKHQREEEKDFIVLRVPNVSSKTLSIIVEYLNHRDSIQERKEMKLKRRLRRREDGFTSRAAAARTTAMMILRSVRRLMMSSLEKREKESNDFTCQRRRR